MSWNAAAARATSTAKLRGVVGGATIRSPAHYPKILGRKALARAECLAGANRHDTCSDRIVAVGAHSGGASGAARATNGASLSERVKHMKHLVSIFLIATAACTGSATIAAGPAPMQPAPVMA